MPSLPTAQSTDRRLSRRQAMGVLSFFPAMAGCTALIRGDTLTESEQVYARLMCNCGCNQGLGECNHIGCPNSVPMRAEVDRLLADGHTPDETVAMFVDKYGTGILSAPSGQGWFNLSAWAMPAVGFVAGAAGVVWYVGRMLGRGKRQESQTETTATETMDRLEHELADFTPED